jgi:hypothetical protein
LSRKFFSHPSYREHHVHQNGRDRRCHTAASHEFLAAVLCRAGQLTLRPEHLSQIIQAATHKKYFASTWQTSILKAYKVLFGLQHYIFTWKLCRPAQKS